MNKVQHLVGVELITLAPGTMRTSLHLGDVLRSVRWPANTRVGSVFLAAQPDGPPLRPPLRVNVRIGADGRVDPAAQWTMQRRDLTHAFPAGHGTCFLVAAANGHVVALAPVRVALPF